MTNTERVEPTDEEYQRVWREMQESIQELEADLGLPAGFHRTVMREPSDWAFVVNVSALVEAALTYLIAKHFAESGIGEFLARKQLGEKLKIAGLAQVLDQQQLAFARAVSSIRNGVLHDVRQMPGFSISRFADDVPSGAAREQLGPLVPYLEHASVDVIRDEMLRRGRTAIVVSLFSFLTAVYSRNAQLRLQQMSAVLQRNATPQKRRVRPSTEGS